MGIKLNFQAADSHEYDLQIINLIAGLVSFFEKKTVNGKNFEKKWTEQKQK